MTLARWSMALALLQPAAAVLAQGTPILDDNQRAYMAAGCYQCHGTVGQGGVGPRLAPKPMPYEALSAFVRHASRNMPPYPPEVVSDADLHRIHAYLSAIAASPPADRIPQLR